MIQDERDDAYWAAAEEAYRTMPAAEFNTAYPDWADDREFARHRARWARQERRAGECHAPHRWGGFNLECIQPKDHAGPHRAGGIEWRSA